MPRHVHAGQEFRQTCTPRSWYDHTAGGGCVRTRVCVRVCGRRGLDHSKEMEGVGLAFRSGRRDVGMASGSWKGGIGVPELERRRELGPS